MTFFEVVVDIHSKNSSEGVRDCTGRVIFLSKRSGIQQSGVVHLDEKKKRKIYVSQ